MTSITGGCLCGGVRYEVSGEPLFARFCCCRDCQRQSGSACCRVGLSGYGPPPDQWGAEALRQDSG